MKAILNNKINKIKFDLLRNPFKYGIGFVVILIFFYYQFVNIYKIEMIITIFKYLNLKILTITMSILYFIITYFFYFSKTFTKEKILLLRINKFKLSLSYHLFSFVFVHIFLLIVFLNLYKILNVYEIIFMWCIFLWINILLMGFVKVLNSIIIVSQLLIYLFVDVKICLIISIVITLLYTYNKYKLPINFERKISFRFVKTTNKFTTPIIYILRKEKIFLGINIYIILILTELFIPQKFQGIILKDALLNFGGSMKVKFTLTTIFFLSTNLGMFINTKLIFVKRIDSIYSKYINKYLYDYFYVFTFCFIILTTILEGFLFPIKLIPYLLFGTSILICATYFLTLIFKRDNVVTYILVFFLTSIETILPSNWNPLMYLILTILIFAFIIIKIFTKNRSIDNYILFARRENEKIQ